ncbi:hypothetical protein [Phaeodactylibacter xiamenensis]|uniref:hypothetical protein n=1 Tax=Phaeodactylibacter xiamenensis TaxID=1524460 RepID=UPI003CCC44D7
MKYLNLILVFFILSSCSENEEQQVLEIHYWTTQEELNDFQKELDDMVVFEGDITIGYDINDLSALLNLTEVTGELSFRSSKLERIHLPNLEYVGELDFRGNTTLTTIDLPKIKMVSDDIFVFGNSALKTIQMNDLQRIEENGIDIISNDSLMTINFQKLELYSYLNFRWNTALNQVNLQKSIPEKCEDISLQFDFVNTNSDLFEDSSTFCFLDLKISNTSNSNLEWLANLDGNNILSNTKVIGEFDIDQFCFLKEKLSQMDNPLRFYVGESFYSSDFSGIEIIQECN